MTNSFKKQTFVQEFCSQDLYEIHNKLFPERKIFQIHHDEDSTNGASLNSFLEILNILIERRLKE